MKLERSFETWLRCDPEAMSKMSQAAIYYALHDARLDILELHAQLEIARSKVAQHEAA